MGLSDEPLAVTIRGPGWDFTPPTIRFLDPCWMATQLTLSERAMGNMSDAERSEMARRKRERNEIARSTRLEPSR